MTLQLLGGLLRDHEESLRSSRRRQPFHSTDPTEDTEGSRSGREESRHKEESKSLGRSSSWKRLRQEATDWVLHLHGSGHCQGEEKNRRGLCYSFCSYKSRREIWSEEDPGTSPGYSLPHHALRWEESESPEETWRGRLLSGHDGCEKSF